MTNLGRGFYGKWFAILTVVLALGMVLAACGSQGSGDNPQNQGTENGNTQGSEQAQGGTDQGKDTTSNLYEEIKSKGKMTVGIMGTYPPYNFLNEKKEMDGFDADIAKEVAKRLGVEVEFVPQEWSGMIAGLKQGKFDVVISQMTITDERKKEMDFSEPYIKNSVRIIVQEGRNDIQSLKDFKGKKIGVGLGTNDETYLRTKVLPEYGPFEIMTYNDVITSLMDLNAGRIDATINNMYAIKPLVEKNGLKIKAVGEPVKSDYAGIAMRKGNPELQKAINEALASMKEDGTYEKIFKKWFGEAPSE
ncbi:MAG: cysteine ABC transporter substrate-binding protein [Bacillus thermozeamaize]|uniref:Cysteine ABC transporter substrate-binding protein n=1 Tax=Bacillus thermozeamaize TaxID=230954 RepID=A0A1Y3PWC0_9BACI|nr:MAG: cysteine ABC transporter substrate-binding protein [Bacillus thermozeamaize]